jgi:hypothetical protein
VGHAANIGGRVVDRHAGTLSLAAGNVEGCRLTAASLVVGPGN